jgi:hypothetical protein
LQLQSDVLRALLGIGSQDTVFNFFWKHDGGIGRQKNYKRIKCFLIDFTKVQPSDLPGILISIQ